MTMPSRLASCLILVAVVVGCRNTDAHKPAAADLPDITPTRIDYIDTDGFDGILENAFVNQDPVVIVRTGRDKPDWDGRLNAWIAAWNRGDRGRRPVFRGVAGPGIPFDAESIKEFRTLVGTLLDKVESLADGGKSWWAEERDRGRRVAVLRPYSLRFHMGEDGTIQLIFFHGAYAAYHKKFMQRLMGSPDEVGIDWTPTVECSGCVAQRKPVEGKLTSSK